MSGPDPVAVEATFSSVAKRYDLANHWLSGGIDFYWRNRLVKFAKRRIRTISSILPPGAGMFYLPCVRGWGMRSILPGWTFVSLCWSRPVQSVPFVVWEMLPINFCMGTASLFLLRMRALISSPLLLVCVTWRTGQKVWRRCNGFYDRVVVLSFLSSVSPICGFVRFIIFT